MAHLKLTGNTFAIPGSLCIQTHSKKVYRTVYQGEESASFASTLHNLGMAFRAMAEDSKKLEKIPLMERAAESFERCVQIREKVRDGTYVHHSSWCTENLCLNPPLATRARRFCPGFTASIAYWGVAAT